ncbi:hypothetical protein E3N88_41828 [Mikania micrantha]|uniref:Uncharacterized protein n=1 Tax=Mikania micrantha TaxID=192012 RepID=A0A5N6LJH8_9ASTR|nr:hypothetical protein E3N88_41828 [Mikania micrantha]
MQQSVGEDNKRLRLNALPDLTIMAVLVEHMEGQRDLITHKSIWHLNDQTIKNIYTLYIMFTVWGCCFFGSTKVIKLECTDNKYTAMKCVRIRIMIQNIIGKMEEMEQGMGVRKEDIEEKARAALWREELIEEIEQRLEGYASWKKPKRRSLSVKKFYL